jgi:Ca2+-binding EF-hand superfamily protein
MARAAATGIGQVTLGEVDGKEHVGVLRKPSDHPSGTVNDLRYALKADTVPEEQPLRISHGQTISLRDVEEALGETREQRELRIRNLFDRFDTSRLGYVDYNQIKNGFKSLSIPSENKYANDLLSVCDSNRDGKVDYGEFKNYMDSKEMELYQMFQELDVKHNGVLAREELQAALGGAGKVTLNSLTCMTDSVFL